MYYFILKIKVCGMMYYFILKNKSVRDYRDKWVHRSGLMFPRIVTHCSGRVLSPAGSSHLVLGGFITSHIVPACCYQQPVVQTSCPKWCYRKPHRSDLLLSQATSFRPNVITSR